MPTLDSVDVYRVPASGAEHTLTERTLPDLETPELLAPRAWEGQVYHGDCLAFMRLLPDACVDAVVTDPPYGTGCRQSFGRGRGQRCNTRIVRHLWDVFDPAWIEEAARLVRPGGAIVSFYSFIRQHELREIAAAIGWRVSMAWWCKRNPPPSFDRRPPSGVESIYVLTPRGKTGLKHPPQRNWWVSVNGGQYRGGGPKHPTAKPIEILEPLVQMTTDPGDLVLDPFLGGGSTGVACDRLGRRWIGCELNPEYAAMAEARVAAQREKLAVEA